MLNKIINRCEHIYVQYNGDPYRVTIETDFEDPRTETISVYRWSDITKDWFKILNNNLTNDVYESIKSNSENDI